MACACCAGNVSGAINRRRFLELSAGAALAAASPFAARAQNEGIELLLLICTDHRIWRPTVDYMKSRELEGKYRPFTIDGGAIGLIADQYRHLAFRQEFWEDLSAAVTWNQVSRIIALDHRDCDAARVAYGLAKTSDRLLETEMHRYALSEFRNRVAERHADVDVEIGLLALDGKVQMFR